MLAPESETIVASEDDAVVNEEFTAFYRHALARRLGIDQEEP